MSDSIVYNASTGITEIPVITEAVDTVIDSSIELANANSKIAELESVILLLNDQSFILKTKIESLTNELKLVDEIKVLILDIKTIDPAIESTFITALSLEQLRILKSSFTRITK
jgi:hypothetical protein